MMVTATALDRNPLDQWAAHRIGIAPEKLSRESIAEYQLAAIRRTIQWARNNSTFYKNYLAEFPAGWPRSLRELAHAPLTSPEQLVNRGHQMLCVPQSNISRVVSLETSGTSGIRKRIFFTSEDQELTLEFFAQGVSSIALRGDRMLIALPSEREGSVGFQLARGITRAGIHPIPHGLIIDPQDTVRLMDRENATLLIGLPVQVLSVAMQRGETATRVFRRLRAIVLCSDHVPQSLVDRIQKNIGCVVFEHYGSTEMGLGGGLDCSAHAGYHLREADLYFEIVSPHNGQPIPDGETGEVVFTTLHRVGTPLIRYRTGDLGRILPGPCCCGSPLRRLARITARLDGSLLLGAADSFTIADLDDALFALPEVYDFTVAVSGTEPRLLQLQIYAPHADPELTTRAQHALMHIQGLSTACANRALHLRITVQDQPFPVTGAKRTIKVQAQQ